MSMLAKQHICVDSSSDHHSFLCGYVYTSVRSPQKLVHTCKHKYIYWIQVSEFCSRCIEVYLYAYTTYQIDGSTAIIVANTGSTGDDDVSFYNITASTWTLATPRTTWESGDPGNTGNIGVTGNTGNICYDRPSHNKISAYRMVVSTPCTVGLGPVNLTIRNVFVYAGHCRACSGVTYHDEQSWVRPTAKYSNTPSFKKGLKT